jgi:hypothetical protein
MVFLLEDIHEHCLSHALLDDRASDPVAIFPSLPNTIGGIGNQAVQETPWGKPNFCRFLHMEVSLSAKFFALIKLFSIFIV